MAHIDHQMFLKLLTERFPDVAASIDDCRQGLLHCEMGAFAHATQAAINGADVETVRRHFQFAGEVFQDAAPDVENAIWVSYLETLRFENPQAEKIKARGLLPPQLQRALAEIEAAWGPS